MLIDLDTVRIAILVIVALVYGLFDVFNKREVPNLFAYASVIVGIVVVATYPLSTITVGVLIAICIAAAGYILYKKGVLGAGDVFELVALTLILPLQPATMFGAAQLVAFPFVLSVFIASGYVSVLLIIVYYLFFAPRSPLERGFKIERKKLLIALALIALYFGLIVMINLAGQITLSGVILLLLIAIPSGILLVFERLINYRMISLVYPKTMTDGDMIATNLMSSADLKYFSGRSKRFGRLVTKGLVADLKTERKKVPVYRNAAPLAAFIFFGVIVSLLFGNLIFLIIKV